MYLLDTFRRGRQLTGDRRDRPLFSWNLRDRQLESANPLGMMLYGALSDEKRAALAEQQGTHWTQVDEDFTRAMQRTVQLDEYRLPAGDWLLMVDRLGWTLDEIEAGLKREEELYGR
jgi:hypothetical protein